MYGLGSEWCLPRSVARRAVAAHQKVSSTAAQCDLIWHLTKGEPATDLARVLPDHRCVMTARYRGRDRCTSIGFGVITKLFIDPHLGKFGR